MLYNNDDIEVEGGDSLIIVQKSFWWKLKKSINPPLVATIIAIPLALIPYSKEYVFTGSGSVLSGNLFRALGIMGAMVSPTINLVLGSNLSEGYPPTADIRWSHIIIIIIGKEVIMPGVGLVLAYTCYYYDIINRCLALMIMIIYAAPTSLQLLMICSGFKSQVENISKLYLIMYCTAAIPLAFWTMGFAIVLYDL